MLKFESAEPLIITPSQVTEGAARGPVASRRRRSANVHRRDHDPPRRDRGRGEGISPSTEPLGITPKHARMQRPDDIRGEACVRRARETANSLTWRSHRMKERGEKHRRRFHNFTISLGKHHTLRVKRLVIGVFFQREIKTRRVGDRLRGDPRPGNRRKSPCGSSAPKDGEARTRSKPTPGFPNPPRVRRDPPPSCYPRYRATPAGSARPVYGRCWKYASSPYAPR